MDIKNKHILNALIIIAVISVSSCSNELTVPDFYPEQPSAINLGITRTSSSSIIVTTKTEHSEGYESYDPRIHPTTMGGFGFKHKKGSNIWHYVFLRNTTTEVTTQDFSRGHTKHIYKEQADFWEYLDENGKVFTERWNGGVYDKHLFFAYLPYQPGDTIDGIPYNVSLQQSSTNSFTFSVPLIPGMSDIPYLTCHEPQIRIISGEDDDDNSRVPFRMDLITQQYLFRFKLDPSMGELRHFHITDIELFGKNMPESATYTLTYTYNQIDDNSWYWTKIEHNFEDYKGVEISEESPFVIKKPVWTKHSGSYYLPLSTTEYRDFGRSYEMSDEETVPSYLYIITPPTFFSPTIKVKYSIYDENGYMTRTGVGTVDLNNKNFNIADWTNNAGYRHEIKINIVPNRLYIISDADQAQGYLILDETE